MERPSQCVHKSPIFTSFPTSCRHDRCLPAKVRSTFECSHSPGQVDVARDHATHQPPVIYVCFQFLPLIKGKHIKVMTDNISSMFYITWQEEATLPLCQGYQALELGHKHNQIVITTVCLPGVQNVTKDSLSRHFFQDHEWKIDSSILHHIFWQ